MPRASGSLAAESPDFAMEHTVAALLLQKRPDPVAAVAATPASVSSQDRLLRALAGLQQPQQLPPSGQSGILAALQRLQQQQQQQQVQAALSSTNFLAALGAQARPAESVGLANLQALALLQSAHTPAPAPSLAAATTISPSTGALLRELMFRTSGNPTAQREIAKMLMANSQA